MILYSTVLHCMMWSYRVMARYCRKIDGKYFAVLAHARNGWQEHKYQADADDDEQWKDDHALRPVHDRDLRLALILPALEWLLRPLHIAGSIGWSVQLTASLNWTLSTVHCSLLTELGNARVNSHPPLWIVRVLKLQRLLIAHYTEGKMHLGKSITLFSELGNRANPYPPL